MKDYLKLLRVKHYIKNILVFIPLFFARELFDVRGIYMFLFDIFGYIHNK